MEISIIFTCNKPIKNKFHTFPETYMDWEQSEIGKKQALRFLLHISWFFYLLGRESNTSKQIKKVKK